MLHLTLHVYLRLANRPSAILANFNAALTGVILLYSAQGVVHAYVDQKVTR